MWPIVVSLILLGIAVAGIYEWGKHKETFDDGDLLGVAFFAGIFFMLYGGYNLGKGNPADASDILNKGRVYSVESAVNRDNKIYATVTNEHGNVYTVVFDKPPPSKFKVVEDKNGQVYIAVP